MNSSFDLVITFLLTTFQRNIEVVTLCRINIINILTYVIERYL